MIRLERHPKPPVEVSDEALMFRLIRASFSQRRKTLVNSLKNSQNLSLSREEIEEALNKCGIPLTIRGEALGLEEFAKLSNYIKKDKKIERRHVLFFYFIFYKGRRIDCSYNRNMKKKLFFITMLVYPQIMRKACLTCKEIMNE